MDNGIHPTLVTLFAILVLVGGIWFQWCAPCSFHGGTSLKDMPGRCLPR